VGNPDEFGYEKYICLIIVAAVLLSEFLLRNSDDFGNQQRFVSFIVLTII
jgi:hypothetical protein